MTLDGRLSLAEDATADAVRAAARSWIGKHVPADWLRAARDGDLAELRRVRPAAGYYAWYAEFAVSGMVAPTWPVQYGGLGLAPDLAKIVDEEVSSARLARLNVLGLGLAGPTILKWGTDKQKAEHLWPIVSNENVWCQLFSEPGAGSDLAGLATRAVRDGETWVVNGQ
jgi:alkylation response protein AidB-like acyl-CoA dehydrogenase